MRVSPLAYQIHQLLDRHRLLRPGARVVVAVSGGPDSVALLTLLAELREMDRLHLWVVYVNHGWRPSAARREAAFVRRLGARLDVPTFVVVIAAGKRPRHSWEGTARQARYAALARVARRLRATAVAVGHTQEDQAETVLLALLRGAGMQGMGGMPMARSLDGTGLRLIRPLLECRHDELRAYLWARRVPWLTDASNRRTAFRRNDIRLTLLPWLARRYGPHIVERLATCATLARDDEAYLTAQVNAWCRRHARARAGAVRLPQAALRREPLALQRRIVRHAIRRVAGSLEGVTFRHVAAVLALSAGRAGSAQLSGGVTASVTRGTLAVRAPCTPRRSMLH